VQAVFLLFRKAAAIIKTILIEKAFKQKTYINVKIKINIFKQILAQALPNGYICSLFVRQQIV
jgi:hypothetical protein